MVAFAPYRSVVYPVVSLCPRVYGCSDSGSDTAAAVSARLSAPGWRHCDAPTVRILANCFSMLDVPRLS